MQLNPRENFTIVRQIEDHTDSNQYYVRAVIRNAKSDAIIQVGGNDYLNLTDRGNQRFSASWLVPNDVSGQGFYISILTSVYTDLGYTTKSQNYGDKIDVYLVQDRFNQNLGGTGGGSDIDYKRIRKIVKEVVSEIEIPEPLEQKVVEVTKEVIKEIKVPEVVTVTKEIIKEVKIPEVIKVESLADFSPMIKKMDEITAEVAKLGKIKPENPVFAQILAKVEKIKDLVTPPVKPIPVPLDMRLENMMGRPIINERTKKIL